MKARFISFVLLALTLQLSGQQFLEVEWEKSYDLAMQDSIYFISKTSQGQYMLSGNSDAMMGDGTGIMIARLDGQGNMIWDKFYQREGGSYFRSMVESDAGGFAVLGRTDSESDNIWVFMIDNSGKVLREKKFGLSSSDVAHEIRVGKKNDFYLCGAKLKQGDGDTDCWIFKVDRKGNMEWQGLFGKRYFNEEARDMILLPEGGSILAGYSEVGKINGPKTPYLVKVDERGSSVWEESYPELMNYTAESVYIDRDGFIIALVVTRKEFTGMAVGAKALRINQSGKLIAQYDIPNPKNSVPRVYTVNGDRIIAIYEKMTPAGEHSGSIIVRLNEDFEHVWIRELDETDDHLLSVVNHAGDQYITAGWTPVESSYKTDAKVMLLKDNSDKLISDFITRERLNRDRQRDGESESSYQARMEMNEKERSSELREYAAISLGMLPEKETAGAIPVHEPVLAEASPTFRSGAGAQAIMAGTYHALLIAVNDYDDNSINDLDQPVKDAEKLYDVLINEYLFEKVNVTLLKNPQREEIINALDRLEGTIEETDNLLIFYAGHGHWDEDTRKGYWLPSDARQSSTANWIRNSSISGYIRGINSKHTLLIADACFSGGIFKTRDAFGSSEMAIERLNKLPSKKAMTSGTLKEVPDRSVFIEYLVKRLYENEDKYLPSEQLFFSFKTAVLNNSDNIPQFGEINGAGDEGGDFIFIRK